MNHDELAAILSALDLDVSEENIEILEDVACDDFIFMIDGKEFRAISEDSIERIHRDEIEELVNECYLSSKDIPDTLRRYFDYDAFARDCRIYNNYGYHFSGYDGSEENESGFYLFRIG